MFANVGFDNPAGNRIFTVKDVSPTSKYVNGVLTETKTADSDKMLFQNMSASTSYAQLVLNHQVRNPHCVVGAITYHDEVRFYRNTNMIEVVGWRFPVPNHEISFRFDTPAVPGVYWLPAARRGTNSFNYMLGGCTRGDYNNQIYGM